MITKMTEKLTEFKNYNVYEQIICELFATVPYYTVGKEEYQDEFDLSTREDLALEICDKLNKEIEDNEIRKT